jgi:hypothetical protein
VSKLSVEALGEIVADVRATSERFRFDGFVVMKDGWSEHVHDGATLFIQGRKITVVGDPYHNPLLDQWVFRYRNEQEPEVAA